MTRLLSPGPYFPRNALLGFGSPFVLPDGRVGALLTIGNPATPRSSRVIFTTYVIFAPIGDRWLIDEIYP